MGVWQLPTDRLPTEHEEQKDFVRWYRRRFPLVRILAIPNGGKRGKAEAAKLAQEGVSAGVPDLYIPEWGYWIEMKKQKGGVISEEQLDWHAYLRSIGYSVSVPKGSVQAQLLVLRFVSALQLRR